MTPAHAAVETEITVSEAVTFPDGIPGFEACRHWVVMAAEAATPLRRLHAIDGTEASFLAIDPRSVLEGYRCELSAADRLRLGAREDEPLLWLALVMMEPSGALTVNLRAPIVINPRTMTGQQVLPHNCLYPLRHVLLPAE
ncbi:MAG TPA: flagellar assembly protein FliW [Vicinamibacterales bacterium]|nr:flagellar assembly protein FliW [Vicinamibacterales bacterium]